MKGKLRLANISGARDRYPLENIRNTRIHKKKIKTVAEISWGSYCLKNVRRIHYSELCLFLSNGIQLDFLPDRSWFHLINLLNSVNTYKRRRAKSCSVLPLHPISPRAEKKKKKEHPRKREAKNPPSEKKEVNV